MENFMKRLLCVVLSMAILIPGLNRARMAVSSNYKRSLHQESSGVCMFQPHRYGADPGGTSHDSQAGASGTGADVSFGSGRAVCGSGVP